MKNTKEDVITRYRAFARSYVKHFNATQAALTAGYSKRGAATMGCKLLKDERVQQMLVEEREKLEQTEEIDRAWVQAQARSLFERCMEIEPVIGQDGETIAHFKFDAKGANSALVTLARTIGAFNDKIEVVDNPLRDFLAALSRQPNSSPMDRLQGQNP